MGDLTPSLRINCRRRIERRAILRYDIWRFTFASDSVPYKALELTVNRSEFVNTRYYMLMPRPQAASKELSVSGEVEDMIPYCFIPIEQGEYDEACGQ